MMMSFVRIQGRPELGQQSRSIRACPACSTPVCRVGSESERQGAALLAVWQFLAINVPHVYSSSASEHRKQFAGRCNGVITLGYDVVVRAQLSEQGSHGLLVWTDPGWGEGGGHCSSHTAACGAAVLPKVADVADMPLVCPQACRLEILVVTRT
eukprot:scpid14689/ scgid6978/ 